MTTLLHISASPRRVRSESIAIADTFIETYADVHPDHAIQHLDLWDGSLPEFGPAAAAARRDRNGSCCSWCFLDAASRLGPDQGHQIADIADKANLKGCFTCHKPHDKQDFVFSFDKMKTAK